MESLDLRGLRCPLPVLRTKKVLKSLAAGDEVEVFATDPQAPKDFQAFCDTTGHTLVSSTEADGVFRFVLRRAAML
jgi:tRNA 2-thiouridine synthesizing protein A